MDHLFPAFFKRLPVFMARERLSAFGFFGQHKDIPHLLFSFVSSHAGVSGLRRGESVISFVTVLQTEIPPCRQPRIHQN